VGLDQGLLRSRWTLLADLQTGRGVAVGRLVGSYRIEPWSASRRPSLLVRAGIATGSQLPQQLFRLGGPGTVRGYDYGTHRAPAFWAAQAEWPLRSGLIQPVLFADAGQADVTARLFDSEALASAGLGVRLAGGIVRLDLSRPFTGSRHRLRFDMAVGL
jgi:outer membrane protein assembly factor BamA